MSIFQLQWITMKIYYQQKERNQFTKHCKAIDNIYCGFDNWVLLPRLSLLVLVPVISVWTASLGRIGPGKTEERMTVIKNKRSKIVKSCKVS